MVQDTIRVFVTKEVGYDGRWSFLHRETAAQVSGLRADMVGQEIANRFEATPPRQHQESYQALLEFSPTELQRLGFTMEDIRSMVNLPPIKNAELRWRFGG